MTQWWNMQILRSVNLVRLGINSIDSKSSWMDENGWDLVRKLRLGANLVLEPQRSVNQLSDEFTEHV